MQFHGRLLISVSLAALLGGTAAHGQRESVGLISEPTQAESNSIATTFVAVPAERFPATQRQLAAVFRGQLQRVGDPASPFWMLTIRGDATRKLTLRFDGQQSGIHVSGPGRLAAEFARLVNRLGETPRQGYRTQVFRLQRENHRSLRGAVQSIRNEKPKPLGASRPTDQSRFVVPAGSIGMVRQTAFQNPAQSNANQGAANPAAANQNQTDDNQPPPALQGMRQFDGVEIESLPELDVIILRGRDPDLAQLADIVEQLERISKETQAKIRILPLQHVSSEAVAEVINQVSEDLVGERQGRGECYAAGQTKRIVADRLG